MSETPNWMNDPAISSIDPKKLEFLNSIISQSKTLGQKEKMALFLNFMKTSKKDNLQFTSDELTLLISTIKKYSTPEELQQLNSMVNRSKK